MWWSLEGREGDISSMFVDWWEREIQWEMGMDDVRVRAAGAASWRKWDPGMALIGSIAGSPRGRKVRVGHRCRQVSRCSGGGLWKFSSAGNRSKIMAE